MIPARVVLLCLSCLAAGVGGTVAAYEWDRMPPKRKAGWRIVDAYSYRLGDNTIVGVTVETTRKAKNDKR